MAASQSWRRISLVLNGHRFQSWSDSEPPVDFPKIEVLKTKTGRDGSLHATDSGMRGGEVTVKLQPTSPSTQRCLQWLTEAARDQHLTFSGSYSDPGTRTAARLKGGRLMSADSIVNPDKEYEATFVFEEIIPSADGGVFVPPPPLSV